MANITLKIDESLLKETRILAAKRGTSVSRLVAEQLEDLVRTDRGYDRAKKRAVERMRSASRLEWQPPVSRDELHVR